MMRFQQVAQRLPSYGLDGLLVLSGPNRQYVTGFPSSAGAALITGAGSWFFTDSRYIEAAQRAITEAEVEENNAAHPTLQMVRREIERLGICRLGIEADRITLAEYRKLCEKLPCELVDGHSLLESMRAIKDEQEVQHMVAAQRIAEKALEETLSFIRAGRTEREIAAFLQYQMLINGGEKMSFDPIVVSGPNSSMPHGVPTDRQVEEGDFITMDFGCVKGGYCSDMTRTVALGHATDEMRQVYEIVLQAQLAGIRTARAGVTGAAIHQAGQDVIADAGYGAYFGHGFGHSLGIEVHESPSAAPSCIDPLPEGVVLSAEPGIYLPGRFGVRIEDVIILEKDGCQNITQAPKDLMIL